jgi:ElaB/YqjD/DUF883 family membrane-anchored ribosome-binding protein
MTDDMVKKGLAGADRIKLQTADALEEAARKLRSADVEDVEDIVLNVESRMDRLKRDVGVKYHEMEVDYHAQMEPVETMISDHPIPAVLIAVGLGFLVGMVICKTRD